MTIEEIQSAQDEIMREADGRALNDDEIKRYEELEGELLRARKSDEIRRLHAAQMAPVATPAVAKGSDEDLERSAFDAYFRTGQVNGDIKRAQSEGTPSAGGYTVADGFVADLFWKKLKDFGGLAGSVRTLDTAKGNPIEWPTFDDTGNVGSIVAENATVNAGADMVFGTKTLGAYKYVSNGTGTAPVLVPVELLQDSEIDIVDLVTSALAERIYRAFSAHIVTGSGVGQPKGLIHGLTGIEIAADGSGITYPDLVNYVHTIDPAYVPNAKWAMNYKSLGVIRKLTDGNDRPLWAPAGNGLAGEMPYGTLLGYPVVIDQAFPDFVANDNTINWGAFGDFRRGYVLRRVKEVQIIRLNEVYATSGQVGFMAWARMDGTQNDTNAYVALTGEA